MNMTTVVLLLLGIGVAAYYAGRSRAERLGGGVGAARNLHSLPGYYGYFTAIWATLPSFALLFAWLLLQERFLILIVASRLPQAVRELPAGQLDLFLNTVLTSAGRPATVPADPVVASAIEHYLTLLNLSQWSVALTVCGLAVLGTFLALRLIHPAFRARNRVEGVIAWFLVAASSIAILTTIGIVLSVFFEALRFFGQVSLSEFLFGTSWSPQTAIRDDQIGSSGSFGIVPLLTGTLLIMSIAMLVAIPIGLMSAVYMAEYSTLRTRAIVKPLLEVLAGIPTVVYGFFAVLSVAPWVRRIGESLGLEVASESALAAGLVMGVMIIPLISSLSDDAIRAVPASIREGATALGATRSETIVGILLPAAMPGIAGGILLAVSRAVGETMIVVMAAGLAANLTVNPLEAVTTVTVQIVTLLVGDQEFDSARTLAAFALGLVLFVMTMLLNVLGLTFVRRYRERYE
ncbi:MAG: phosphate ABC transporter permease subunit PstC [Pseudomonadota bacterium]